LAKNQRRRRDVYSSALDVRGLVVSARR